MDLQDSERTGWAWRWIPVTGMLMGLMLVLYYLVPSFKIGPEQPIPFSHRIHSGVKQISCRFCHPYVERSKNAGIPTMKKCFFCHEYIIPKHPWIAREREHYDSKNPVPWVRVYNVPDHVKFSHQPHIRWAKLECTACHGQVQTMDRLRSVNFPMGFCIGCHRQKNAQLDCWLACHH